MLPEPDLLYFISPILKSEKIKMHKTYQELESLCICIYDSKVYILGSCQRPCNQ